MSRRHWRKVKQALSRGLFTWDMKGVSGYVVHWLSGDIRKHRNAWSRNGKTAAQWFPAGVDPKRVVRMPQFYI
jgi:hypothetical protein